jgi:type I restriction enzyme S subunit
MASVSDSQGEIEASQVRPFGEIKKGYTRFQSGDVIFAKITPCMENGKIAVARELKNGLACGSTEFHVLRPMPCVAADFLWKFLRQKSFRADAEREMTGAVGQRRVPVDFLSRSVLPLPPLPEQRRIVAKIDHLSGTSERAREQLDHLPSLIEKYKQAILTAAFSGKLTQEWRTLNHCGDDLEPITAEISFPYRRQFSAPSSWHRFKFEQVCRIEGGSQPPKSTFEYAPAPHLIRLVQIRDYKSDDRITFIPKKLARRFCTADDIMIGRYGPPIFQILRGIEGAYNVALMKAVPNTDLVTKDYLYRYLNFPALRAYVEFEAQRTVGQDGVNKRHLLEWPILLPPLLEQHEMVRRIEQAFSWIDHLGSEAAGARNLIDHLDQGILAKAFRGGLVPQDPADEPASVLLDSIRSEQATATGKRRPRERAAALTQVRQSRVGDVSTPARAGRSYWK